MEMTQFIVIFYIKASRLTKEIVKKANRNKGKPVSIDQLIDYFIF